MKTLSERLPIQEGPQKGASSSRVRIAALLGGALALAACNGDKAFENAAPQEVGVAVTQGNGEEIITDNLEIKTTPVEGSENYAFTYTLMILDPTTGEKKTEIVVPTEVGRPGLRDKFFMTDQILVGSDGYARFDLEAGEAMWTQSHTGKPYEKLMGEVDELYHTGPFDVTIGFFSPLACPEADDIYFTIDPDTGAITKQGTRKPPECTWKPE